MAEPERYSGRQVGVVGIPGKWSTETLADAIAQRTGFRCVIDMGKVAWRSDGAGPRHGATDLTTLDGLVIKKISGDYNPNSLDRLELLRRVEAQGVRIFSPPENLLRMINRLACTVTLQNAGIPMPDTCVTEDLDVAVEAVRSYGSAVCKPLYSTKARGMCVIDGTGPGKRVRAAVEQFRRDHPLMYLQRRVDFEGRDFGVVFVGGRYLCTYARVSRDGAWNTTTSSGGRYAAHTPSAAVLEVATRAQARFGLDFTTVDVAETVQGPVVFEVSAFGGLRGALEGAGVDAASALAEHALGALPT